LIATLLAGSGLSAASGLNAYLPLLILALADRFTSVIELGQPYDIISSNWGLIILLLILPIELIPDKISRLDHLNDLLHTAIRPAAGAITFMAYASQDDDLQPVIALIVGLLIAAGVHWLKSSNRPHISVRTRGIGNPFISMLEDALSILVALLAVFLPYSMIVILPFAAWILTRSYRRMRTGETRIMALLGNQSPPASHA